MNAPPGYTVSVSPSVLTLAAGASATYEVTITNVSAPIGEWRFGSLSWGSPFQAKVQSPIAVKGAKFAAPAEVTGSGASGTASFPVKFGYTGAYAAVPSGLTRGDAERRDRRRRIRTRRSHPATSATVQPCTRST